MSRLADSVDGQALYAHALFSMLEEGSVTITVAPKMKTTTVLLHIQPTEAEQASVGFRSVELAVEMTGKETPVTLTFPKEEDVLSEEEVQALFQKSGFTEPKKAALSENEFEDLKESLEELTEEDTITPEIKQEFLENYQEVLTKKQYQEIEAMFEE
ncbi:hypothetical protein HQ866_11350 [Enterococcus faecium]|nr:hypothetical protein [Enterococcus faecium]